MENFKAEGIPQNVRCLANHKLKARIRKNTMMRDRINQKEDYLGAKIIKYETFLSQNMLQDIKTQELIQFQQQVRQFCQNKKSIVPLKSQIVQKGVNMHSIFDQVRKQVKVKERTKRRSKTYQNSQSNFMLFAKPTQLMQRENISGEQSKSSQFVRDQLDENNQYKIKRNQMNLRGKIMNSSLVGIMEKMEDMKYFSNQTGRKLGKIIQLQSPFQLKEQKQRLSTALEGNQRVKFVPIGKISEKSTKIHSQEKLFVPLMPKIGNRNAHENIQKKKINNAQKKVVQMRKSTLKFENQLGLKFKSKRKSTHFSHLDRFNQDENNQMEEIKCF